MAIGKAPVNYMCSDRDAAVLSLADTNCAVPLVWENLCSALVGKAEKPKSEFVAELGQPHESHTTSGP